MPKSVLRMLWAHCSCALRGREKGVVGGSNIPTQVLQIEGSTEEKEKKGEEKKIGDLKEVLHVLQSCWKPNFRLKFMTRTALSCHFIPSVDC